METDVLKQASKAKEGNTIIMFGPLVFGAVLVLLRSAQPHLVPRLKNTTSTPRDTSILKDWWHMRKIINKQKKMNKKSRKKKVNEKEH
jgi:hypothetical protein